MAPRNTTLPVKNEFQNRILPYLHTVHRSDSTLLVPSSQILTKIQEKTGEQDVRTGCDLREDKLIGKRLFHRFILRKEQQ